MPCAMLSADQVGCCAVCCRQSLTRGRSCAPNWTGRRRSCKSGRRRWTRRSSSRQRRRNVSKWQTISNTTQMWYQMWYSIRTCFIHFTTTTWTTWARRSSRRQQQHNTTACCDQERLGAVWLQLFPVSLLLALHPTSLSAHACIRQQVTPACMQSVEMQRLSTEQTRLRAQEEEHEALLQGL